MKQIRDLMDGYKTFRTRTFPANRTLYQDLVKHGQSPRVMIVSCCDSRVEPTVILNSRPGELFMVRNVANLVPPYEPHGDYHGTSAALEFAVTGLKVEHVIVLGHAYCGGVQAFLNDLYGQDQSSEYRFISRWMSLLRPAMTKLQGADAPRDPAARQRALEQASIVHSLANLETFPFVRAQVEAGKLNLHGAWFDIERGLLLEYDPASRNYVALTGEESDVR
jgi:carbonic anhydrase